MQACGFRGNAFPYSSTIEMIVLFTYYSMFGSTAGYTRLF